MKARIEDGSNMQHYRNECSTLELPSAVRTIVLDLKHPRVISICGLGRKNKSRQWHLKITNKGNLVLV